MNNVNLHVFFVLLYLKKKQKKNNNLSLTKETINTLKIIVIPYLCYDCKWKYKIKFSIYQFYSKIEPALNAGFNFSQHQHRYEKKTFSLQTIKSYNIRQYSVIPLLSYPKLKPEK